MNQVSSELELIGVWKLVKYSSILDGSSEVVYPYGEDAKGYLIYTPEGFVSVNIMRGHRTLHNTSMEVKIEVSENFGGYVGRYTIFGNTVTHYPEISGFLNYIQKPQTRQFKISGSLLTLEYHHAFEEHSHIQTADTSSQSQLIWQRVFK